MTPEDDGDITIYPELAAVDEMECIGWQYEYVCPLGVLWCNSTARSLRDAQLAARAHASTGRIRRVYAGAPIRITDNEETTEFP